MNEVKIWEEKVVLPTYEIGQPDRNPIFLEKRVYQGSSGKIYPYPTIEKISDEKVDKEYNAVFLENEYIRVMILPELGGRIHRAYDKTNDYDFVYYNHVIKPALVGLLGPWISGGIEFNWPQHHRPTTFLPVDHRIRENEDGSKTLLVNDVDQMYGTKAIAAFTLYPGKAYIEIKGQLYNRTSTPQTFLWWANPAVAVNDHTQSVFPPDVRAVMDHGKRDVSGFPIATGVYYKHDYSAGVDISRYKNIPVPTSYMAEKSDYDFVGGYDHQRKAGILHVADHHVSPGKKQWTWGNGDFGKAWDRNLTDSDGPYIELMTGVYTDNQPDFTWLKPFEEKSFKQYFMPYKAVGAVKNATICAAVNMELTEEGIKAGVYATGRYENAVIRISNRERILHEAKAVISPVEIYEETIPPAAGNPVEDETDLKIEVYADGELLVEYQPQPKKEQELPKPAEEAKDPEEIKTNEELYLTGLHLEQYRHATYSPEAYYLEGLKRDEGDIRINNAYGKLLLLRGAFREAEGYFRKALQRAVWKNPNPYDSEPYYNLGLSLFYQDKMKEAYDAFYKATWSGEQQEMSFYYLSAIDAKQGNYVSALELITKGLIKNSHNIKARGLKAYLLRKLGCLDTAGDWIHENLDVDGFDYLSMFEMSRLEEADQSRIQKDMCRLMRDHTENFLQVARDYAEFGAYEEAVLVLRLCGQPSPLLYYYEAYYSDKLNSSGKAKNTDAVYHSYKALDKENHTEAACNAISGSVSHETKSIFDRAESTRPDYCFPNKPEDIAVLYHAINHNPKGAKAYYYLGNLFYDKKQYDLAVKLWESSAELDDRFPTVLRNLALAYYNKQNQLERARKILEKAFELDRTDSRIFMELDQLYKKLGVSCGERLKNYEAYPGLYRDRDDLAIEYITLHNQLGRYEEAYQLIMGRRFHPWEGGEGKVTTQYTIALVELAKKAIAGKEYKKAEDYLKQALSYPENLGEGKLEGTGDNHIYYYLGYAAELSAAEDNTAEGAEAVHEYREKAREYYKKASQGAGEPAGMMYYNDQPADMILYQGFAFQKLGSREEAAARFCSLTEYGEKHLKDHVRIGYFAVSLPDFLIFEEDLDIRNQAHCYYLIGLGNIGSGRLEEAEEALEKALSLDQNHINCLRYLNDIKVMMR